MMKKLINYRKFLEKDNIRNDEFSHLNDDLGNWNARNFSGYDREDEWDDDGFDYLNNDDDITDGTRSSFRNNELDDRQLDDMNQLIYLLTTYFKNKGIEVEVEHKNFDMMIYCSMEKKERLKDIIEVFSVANKVKRDILAQYDCEFEMWISKDGSPILAFNFYYGDGLGDSNAPF